jgi:hypothetical protein
MFGAFKYCVLWRDRAVPEMQKVSVLLDFCRLPSF